MEVLNNIYDGYNDIDELINQIKKIGIEDFTFYKVVKFKNNYYVIGYESPFKIIIIGAKIVWYISKNGYLVSKDIINFKMPYQINSCMWVSFSNKLVDKMYELDNDMKLYNINANSLIECKSIKNCCFLQLGKTFCDIYYNRLECSNSEYISKKNKKLIEQYIFENNYYTVVSINPFINNIIVKNNIGAKNEIKYKALYSERIINDHEIIYTISAFEIREFNIKLQQIKKLENHIKVKEIETIDCNFIDKVFKDDQLVIELAENDMLNLNRNIIEYMINQQYNIKLYISKLSNKKINTLLSIDGECIRYIDNQTKTMKFISAGENPKNVIYFKDFNVQLFDEIQKEYPECIKYISYLDEDIQRHVLDSDIDNIKYFIDCDKEILKDYINSISIDLIQNPQLKNTVLLYKEKDACINSKEHIDRAIDSYRLNLRYKNIFEYSLLGKDYETALINNNEALDSHINYLAKKIHCKSICIGTGYIYKNGLLLVEDLLNSPSLKDHTRIIVGSLNYNFNDGIESNTADYLNQLIKKGIKINTLAERFYHGKIYIMCGEEFSCVIIGSSNVSRAGFYGNCETNILFIIRNNTSKINEFINYYDELWTKSYSVKEFRVIEKFLPKSDHLEEEDGKNINDMMREFDYIRKQKPDKEINSIDAFIGCIYNDDYTGFYFKKYNNLLILESLVYQNAIYIFKNVTDIMNFLITLKNKEQCTKIPEYVERLNHTKDGSHKQRVLDIIQKYKNYVFKHNS